MLKLPGYSNLVQIHEQPHVMIYRAHSEQLKTNVLLKVLRSEYPTPEESARYENEFSILKDDLGPGIPRAFEMLQIDKMRVMVLEDIGGQSLAEEMTARQLSLPEKLDLSVTIVKALATVQELGIIHRDIKPANIVLNRRTGRLQIIDFGLATRSREISTEKTKSFVGTLQYMSPEQTGRTQRTIDYRTDYYSLGITLYQLFSNQLPFQGGDEMEWLHSHIALAETPLHKLNADIPLPVSQIVQKMMKKAAGDRYQSCLGMIKDLSLCREMTEQGKGVTDFAPGTDDISAEFRLSSKLYGRDAEVALVNKVLKNAVLGGKRMILAGGEPGVGKTSVCNVIRDGAIAADGYYIFGKYDQFRKDVPFSALISSFNQLINQILAEDEGQIKNWRERLMKALGANAAVVCEVIPQLELIIGKPDPVPELEGIELRVRFQNTFHAFIAACCQLGKPLVIFLDDLQWSDSASRTLISTFMVEKEADSLLLVGAYRDEHIDAAHPLTAFFRTIEDAKIAVDQMFLKSLSQTDIFNLVYDSFHGSKKASMELADLVTAKTGGNPFFVSQFLKALNDKGLLTFDAADGWTWDLEKIRAQGVTDNVLTLLTEKIEGLPAPSRNILMIASCFGNYFQMAEIKTHNEETDEHNLATLQPAVRNGLIIELKEGQYKFIHDRVQEASYKMLPIEERETIHWRIAKNLLASWDEEQIRVGIFYLANHWNAGSSLIASVSEREKSAELNLMAASTAKNSSVYEAALHHAQTGLTLLRSENWQMYEHFLRPLLLICAECEFALGRFKESEEIFPKLLANVTDPLRRARIYRLLVDLTNMQGRNKESIRWGQKGLALLGFHLPDNPGKLILLYKIMKARFLVRRSIRAQKQLLSTTAKREIFREIMRLCSSIAAPTYQENKSQLVYVTLELIPRSLREGHMETNSAFLAALVWNRFWNFNESKEMVESLLPYYDQNNLENLNPNDFRTCYSLGGFTLHLTHSGRKALQILKVGVEYLIQNGDFSYALYCAHYVSGISILIEPKLSRALEVVTENRELIKKNPQLYDSLILQDTWVRVFQGDIEYDWNLEDFKKKLHSPEILTSEAWHVMMAQAYYFIMGDHQRSLSLVESCKDSIVHVPFAMFTIFSRFMATLSKVRNIQSFEGSEKRRIIREIRSEMKFFRKLSSVTPNNYLPMYSLLAAGWNRYRGRTDKEVQNLQKAVDAAKQSEIPVLEALANELLAEAFINQGLEKVAILYLREALFVYENWGALAKVKQLLATYPNLRPANAVRSSGSQTSLTSNVTLDINTVLKASNALISEIDMGRLAKKLLSILIENAGAERGVLVLIENGQLFAAGELRVNSDKEFELTHTPIQAFENIPRSIVSYVARTQESMVLESAHTDDRASRDEYVQREKILSTVCIPISAGGELKGMVYLENNASAGIFSADRVQLMQTLAGQIAISLENARMYEKQGEAIRMQNELATAHTVQEMLFPAPVYQSENVNIAGYYRPATECGGDWWYYSAMGDWVYVWVGDATGHGAPAALVTSSACSAVSVLESDPDLTPEKAMTYLNRAVCRTTKGKINMTFFVGALNSKTGEFKFTRASHDAPFLIRGDKATGTSFVEFRGNLEPLQGINGRRLGESLDEVFESSSVQLRPGDTIIFYTDGLPDIANDEKRQWGERGFLHAFFEGVSAGQNPEEITKHIVAKADGFKKDVELADDITICILQFKGAIDGALKKSA